jgi:hypothetical protein
MISSRKLQNALLDFLTASAPLEGVNFRGSDDTRPVALPMLVVHVASIKEEWEATGIWRCSVGFQLHTQVNDEDGEVASERLDKLADALEDECALEEALAEHFVLSAAINQGLTLNHTETQMIHALRFDFILSEQPDED